MASSMALSMPAAKVVKGVMASRYTVPPLPSMVTKPVRLLETMRHSRRVMPVVSSFSGLPRASTMVPVSTLPFVLLFAIAKTSVSVMPCLQTYCLLKTSLKSARLMWSSLSVSMCLKRARRRCSVKVTSSRLVVSGSDSRYAMKASCVTFSAPICLKSASSVSSLAAMWSRSTLASVCALHATRNSSPPCSSSGAQAAVALAMSASIFSSSAFASASSF
mmetsp:Transcript_12480/g.39049  ORF Transcript_12480/g.39049 Transcript_12480/m.39049 type:complete len:219 (-) Transcript_12480:2412-3068(-)